MYPRYSSRLGFGSPGRPTLRTFAWAWFRLPRPVSNGALPKSSNRRNPIALAQEWRDRLDEGDATSRADLAYQLGVTRAHVTQVLSLLELSKEVRDAVLRFGDPIKVKGLGIHTLRSIFGLPSEKQLRHIEASTAAE